MKTKIIQFGCLLLIATATFSCGKLDEVLTKEIQVNNRTINFTVNPAAKSAEAQATRSGETETVLYDGVLEINVVEELENNGLSFENLKSFVLRESSITLVTPSGYDMNGFKTVKLYFGDTSKPVAKAESVSGSKVVLSIVNGELLDKLKEDKLRVIVTGQRSSQQVTLKLRMDYTAKVGLTK